MQKSLSSGLIPLSSKERAVGGSASRRKQPNINDDDDDLDMDSMLNDIMSSSDKKTKSKTSTSSSFSPYGRGGAEGPTFSSFSPKLKKTEVALQDEDDHFSFDESNKSPSPPPILSSRLGAASPSFSRRSRPASKPAASIDSSPSSVHTSTASTLRQEGFSSTLESRPSIPARSPAEDDLFNDDFDLDDDIFGDILGTKTKAKSKPLATSKSIDSLRTSDIQIGSAEKEKVSSSRPRTAPSSVISNKAIDLGEENATVGSDGPELGFVPSFFDGERRSRRTLGRQDSKSDIQVSKSLDMFTSDDSLAPRKRVQDPFANTAPISYSSESLKKASSTTTEAVPVHVSSSAYPKSSGGSNGASDDEDGGLANSMRSSLPAQEVRPRHLTLETSAAQVDSTDQYSPLPSSMSKERRRSAVASVTFDESEKAEIGDEKERYHDAVKGSKPLSEIIQPSSSVLSSSLQRASPEMMTSPIGSRGARSAALVATIDTDALAQRTEEALQRMQKSIIDSAAMEKESMTSQMSELKRFFASTSSSTSDDLLTAQKRIRELESQVSSLVTEVSALKDAAAISALQAVENEKYLKARHAEELASLEKRFEESRADVSRRHQEGVDALKRLHIEEIASVRERSKDGQALEALATQIRTTSGSMRLIEEQLTQRHSGLELIKEGQLDARERLLTELEAKARERAETAEAESYRLKGLLSHMESMAISLRGQNGEEKERLRQEHLRLQSLQASIEAERSSLHARGRDDAEESMRRKEEARELLRSAEDERQRFLEEISIQRKKLEIDRAEFSAFVMRSTSASDAAAQSLKEEENRLQRLREDVMEQRNILTQQKAAAMSDLSVASELRREFDVLRREIEFERNEVEQTAAELHRTSELLHAKDEELRAMSMDFASREQVLREGFEKVSSVGDSVLRRETELKYHAQQLGLHQMELDRMDGEMAQRRVSLASSQREALRKNPHYSLTLMSPRQAPAQQTRPQRAHPQTLAIQDQFSNIDSFEEKSSLDMACRKSDAWAILKLNRGVDGAPELKLARKAMASVRTQLGRYAEDNKDIRRSTDGLHKVGVDTESSLFVDRLMSKRGL